jgi:hypothetical protein
MPDSILQRYLGVKRVVMQKACQLCRSLCELCRYVARFLRGSLSAHRVMRVMSDNVATQQKTLSDITAQNWRCEPTALCGPLCVELAGRRSRYARIVYASSWSPADVRVMQESCQPSAIAQALDGGREGRGGGFCQLVAVATGAGTIDDCTPMRHITDITPTAMRQCAT